MFHFKNMVSSELKIKQKVLPHNYKLFLLACCIGCLLPVISTAQLAISSPDKKIDFVVSVNNGKLNYTLRQQTKPGEEVIEDQRVAPQSQAFLEEWLARCQELVDKYKPDMFWFDNGVNSRSLDSIKLRFAAYYYNRGTQWKKAVSISTKSDAYLAGSIKDFERQGRAPKELTDYVWQVNDPIGEKFGYVEGMKLTNAGTVIRRLVENVSRNGNYMLNISPKSDGTIPDAQKEILLGVGKWLDLNGESIYGTRAWKQYGEGQFRFTKKGKALYAITMQWPTQPIVLSAFPTSVGKIKRVSLLGSQKPMSFTQNETGLKLIFPEEKFGENGWVLKLEGLNL